MQSMSSRMALLGDAVTPLCDLLSALDADKEARLPQPAPSLSPPASIVGL